MRDDGESVYADPASSPAPLLWGRGVAAIPVGAVVVLLVCTTGPPGAGGLIRAATAVALLAAATPVFSGGARQPQALPDHVPMAASAVLIGLLQLASPAAAGTVPTLAVAALLLASALGALGLGLQVRRVLPWSYPGGGWDPVVTGLGTAALGTATLDLAVRAAGPQVSAAAIGLTAVSTLLGATAVSAATQVATTPRVDVRRICIATVAVAVADQVSLAARGLPALVPGPGLPGSAGAAWPLAAALAVGGLAAAAWWPEPVERRLLIAGYRPAPATLVTTAGCVVLVGAVLLVDGEGPLLRAAALLGLAPLLAASVGATRQHRARPGPGGDVRPRTDDLTGLANRRALAEALAGERSAGTGDETLGGWSGWAGWSDEIALLLVDLDNFKDVNDALGHEAGDRLLAAVGVRLRAALRPTQLLARLGGDEFAVVLPAAGVEQAARVAADLRDSLGPEFEIDGTRLHVQASVGAATCDPARGEPRDLLRQADVAMYQAKADGLGVAFYDPDTDDARTGDRLRRTGELRDALQRGDLEVYLQPQVDLRSGAIVGAEALARWRHPQDGVLLPDSFLPLAERTGLMRPVTAQLVDRALEACATWWQAGHKVTVSVNLGAGDLREPDVGRQISTLLDRHRLPPAALRVEITEQALLRDPVAVAATLQAWRAEGITVAVDDFGTGYSSLSYLRMLPVDEVKLDRAFVGDAARPRSATIVRHTAAMAHDLGAVVVAEGIEDGATARLVARLGCDVGQGLHFGAAMTVEQFLTRLE